MLCFRRFEWLLPLGEGWDGASMLVAESPSPVSLFGETGEGLVAAFSLPLGRVGEGLLGSRRGAFGLFLSLHL